MCITVAIGAAVGYHSWKTHIPTEIAYIHSDIAHNTDNPRENVSVQPYVFVGYVEEALDYMTEKYTREFPKVITEFDSETTECNVKVIKTLKEYVDAAENQVSFGKDLLTEFLAKADKK